MTCDPITITDLPYNEDSHVYLYADFTAIVNSNKDILELEVIV